MLGNGEIQDLEVKHRLSLLHNLMYNDQQNMRLMEERIMYTMRYDTPGSIWMDGLPLGNGRLAAMVWGDAREDILTLNHEWLWRGTHRGRQVQQRAAHLPAVRDLLWQGKYEQATLEGNRYFGGEGGMMGNENQVDAYQPAGELHLSVAEASFIERVLDLEHGTVCTSRQTPTARIDATYYASSHSGVVAAYWQASSPFDCALSLSRVADEGAVTTLHTAGNRLLFDCAFAGGIQYRILCQVDTDGRVTATDTGLMIEGASYIACVADIGTSIKGIDAELSLRLPAFGTVQEDLAAHRDLFSRRMQAIDLQVDEDPALLSLSIEERMRRFKAGQRDNGICTLYYHYGRYLLLSASAGGELPANLQGKWNNMIDPPWQSDYHFDINLQMNYWMAEPCRMPESADALLRYLESFYESGATAARALYGCRGIWLPLQTDAWGISTPESYGWAVWIGAAPWMAMHFWQHYTYSGDLDFLRNRAYRFFVAVAEFYEDYLVEDDQGILQILPSQSPENRFEGGGELPVTLCNSSAMDVQLCYDALGYAIAAAQLLGIDQDRIKTWKAMQDKLPGFPIGSDGRLMEWQAEEIELEPGHRHLSHLYGVYPSDLFSRQVRPAQYEAARKSLAYRLSHGGGHTGWSRTWVACLQARFGSADGFYEHYTALIRDFATATLLDLHPPELFQIDGNYGAVAAVNDALVQPVNQAVWLLPALPAQWAGGGHLRGIRVPGGHTIDMAWREGHLTSLAVTIGYSKSIILHYEGQRRELGGQTGEILQIL